MTHDAKISYGLSTPKAGGATWRRTALLCMAIVVLVWVAFFAGYKLRPRLNAESLVTLYAKYILRQPSHKEELEKHVLPMAMKTDYRALIGLYSAGDVAARRRAAAAYIFRGDPPSGGLARRPDVVEPDVLFLPLADLSNLAGIDRLTVTMPYGVNSVIFHLKPKRDNNCLMVYQEGHRVSFLARKPFLKRLLGEGCHVVALSLPLTGGLNNRPEIDHPRFGHFLLNDPDDLEFLDNDASSSLQYFMTPLVAALNHALDGRSFGRVGATGFSGGGWAVEILAALDPRITASYAVAGSAPTAILAAMPQWGSPEQRQTRFYETVSYTELYVMGAAGVGRRQLQFFNDTDPCCFAGETWRAYRDAVAERARALGGSFRILTYVSQDHRLTKPVSLAIVDDFLNGGKNLPEGIAAP